MLYTAVMANTLCRYRLALYTVALANAHGREYADGSGSWPWDGESGVYIIVGGEPLGWLPLDALLVTP